MGVTTAIKRGILYCLSMSKEIKMGVRAKRHRVEHESAEEYTLYRVSCGSSKPLTVEVILSKQMLAMEVDTGASVSLMGKVISALVAKRSSNTTNKYQAVNVHRGSHSGGGNNRCQSSTQRSNGYPTSHYNSRFRPLFTWLQLADCTQSGLASHFSGGNSSYNARTTRHREVFEEKLRKVKGTMADSC